MKEQIKEILLKQMQLLQDACEREMSPEDAARLSAMLAEALALVNSFTPPLPIYRELVSSSCALITKSEVEST